LGRTIYAWQVNTEDRALPRFAVDPDRPAALFHDPVYRRQAEPGSLALLLGGKEGLEDPFLRSAIHADAGIAHTQAYILPGMRARPLPRFRIVNGPVAGRNGEPSALRHRIARIHRKIHQDLFH